MLVVCSLGCRWRRSKIGALGACRMGMRSRGLGNEWLGARGRDVGGAGAKAAMSGIKVHGGQNGSKLTLMTWYLYVPRHGTVEASCGMQRRERESQGGRFKGGKGMVRA